MICMVKQFKSQLLSTCYKLVVDLGEGLELSYRGWSTVGGRFGFRSCGKYLSS
jgi:hypothetical protein